LDFMTGLWVHKMWSLATVRITKHTQCLLEFVWYVACFIGWVKTKTVYATFIYIAVYNTQSRMALVSLSVIGDIRQVCTQLNISHTKKKWKNETAVIFICASIPAQLSCSPTNMA
jgi:hypothetical protein